MLLVIRKYTSDLLLGFFMASLPADRTSETLLGYFGLVHSGISLQRLTLLFFVCCCT